MTKNQHIKFAKRKHQKQLKRNAKNKNLRFQRLMAKIAAGKLVVQLETNVYSNNSTCLLYDAALCRCLKIMNEEAIDELMLDIIEIVNPVGDVLDEIEKRFNEFKKEL